MIGVNDRVSWGQRLKGGGGDDVIWAASPGLDPSIGEYRSVIEAGSGNDWLVSEPARVLGQGGNDVATFPLWNAATHADFGGGNDWACNQAIDRKVVGGSGRVEAVPRGDSRRAGNRAWRPSGTRANNRPDLRRLASSIPLRVQAEWVADRGVQNEQAPGIVGFRGLA